MAFGFIAASDRQKAPLFREDEHAQQRAFFAARPELTPTPLRRFRGLARRLGLGEVRAKDETERFGLNAFKAAGAMFAVATLRERGELAAGETLVCASEGNHGRAVARAARETGCRARVYVASSVAASRVHAIEAEGAAVIAVPGTYDDAVRMMADEARQHGWRVISDTSLPDLSRRSSEENQRAKADDVPRLIMLGYTRLMDEAQAQWQPGPPPDAIFVPGGVGGLLAAVADWVSHRFDDQRPAIIGVEPTSAACLQISVREGRPTTLGGPFDTVMAGLRCGEVSRAGFDTVRGGVDAYVAIEDHWALDAMRQLASGADGDPVVEAGASGSAALGGLLATVRDPGLDKVKNRLGLGRGSRVLLMITEGVTDPELFAGVVGRPKSEHPDDRMREPT